MADKPKKPQKLRARLPRGLVDRTPSELAATLVTHLRSRVPSLASILSAAVGPSNGPVSERNFLTSLGAWLLNAQYRLCT